MLNKTELIDIVNDACKKCGVPELSSKIHIVFSKRMFRCAGRAKYIIHKYELDNILIKLSSRVFGLSSHAQNVNTVYHEVCHVIAAYVALNQDSYNEYSPHGPLWQYCMRKCGQIPTRLHPLMIESKKRQRYLAKCECVKPIVVGPTQYKRILSGRKYRCKKCLKVLSVDQICEHNS